MKKYLQKRYLLSDEGFDYVKKSILSSTLLYIVFMFPLLFSFVFLNVNISKIFNEDVFYDFSLRDSLVIAIVVFILMYVIGKIDYDRCFVRIFDESARARLKLAEKLKKLPLSYFSKKDIADLSATIMSDATTFEQLFAHIVPKVYGNIITIGITLVIMFVVDYRLSLAIFWVLPFAYFVFLYEKKQVKKIFRAGFDLKREIIDDFQEGLDLVQEIKAYNREADTVKNLNIKFTKQYNENVKSEFTAGALLNVSFLLLKLGMPSVAIYGAYLFIDNKITLFTYLTFIILSAFIFNPLIRLIKTSTLMLYVDSVIERMKEIENMPSQEGSTQFKPNGYDIKFENVDFSYEDDITVLKDVSFVAKQGEVTALVGPSGSGKTTAAKLAARFWDIQGGKITLGGVDISKIDPETLLKEFSIVFQDVSLFNSTIMENIRLGKMGASDAEVKRVAKIARCDEFIKQLPEGYDTLIGENGTKLSGGERQRISIARALLKDAPIILLDESTASLDAENESKIQEGISELVKDKTVIIIAHRMRTILDADNIVVLKDGKVVENGKSQELIERNGVFAGMYKAQFS